MRIHLRLLFVIMVAAVAASGRQCIAQDTDVPAASEAPVPAEPDSPFDDGLPKPKSFATCWLRIAAGDDEISLKAIRDLLQDKALLNDVIRGADSKDTDDRDWSESRRRVLIWSSRGSQSVHGNVMAMPISIQSYDDRILAEKLLEPVAKELEKALRALVQPDVEWVDRELSLINREVKKSEMLYLRSVKIAKRIRGSGRRRGISGERMEENVQRLQSQQQELQLTLLGLEARQRAIEEWMAEIAERVEEEASGDEVIDKLGEVIELKKRRIDHLRRTNEVAKGAVDEMTIDHARLELAASSAELAQYRRSAMREAGGDQLAALNMRLTETEIEREEIAARLEYLVARAIPEAEKGLSKAQQLEYVNREAAQDAERYELEREMARQQWREALGQRYEIQRRLNRYRRPTVTIIRSD